MSSRHILLILIFLSSSCTSVDTSDNTDTSEEPVIDTMELIPPSDTSTAIAPEYTPPEIPQPYTKYVLVTMDVVSKTTIRYPQLDNRVTENTMEDIDQDLHIFTLQFNPDEDVEERMAIVMDSWEQELLKKNFHASETRNRKYYILDSYKEASELRQKLK